MFDTHLRPVKQRVFAPFVAAASNLSPTVLTATGLGFGLASAVAAADARWWPALGLFAANRIADGLDGDVARSRSEATDQGGYADMVFDTIIYAAIPLGAAAGSDIDHIWPVAAFLIASFYVNSISWSYLAALIEKRGRAETGQPSTSIVMPAGLVEGAETMVFFAVMLTFPSVLDWTMGVMAAAVSIGAMVRFSLGHRALHRASDTEIRAEL